MTNRSAMFCNHANEVPTSACDCDSHCYCRGRTCKHSSDSSDAITIPVKLYPREVHRLSDPEPAPTKNNLPAVWDLVITDMQSRDQFGLDKYKTRLQPHNGRDALVDVYQEILDAAVYIRQLIYERDGK